MVFLTFLAGLLQRFLKLLNFLGELHKVMVYGITFLTAFLSGAEIGFGVVHAWVGHWITSLTLP